MNWQKAWMPRTHGHPLFALKFPAMDVQDTQSGNPEQESAKSGRADIRFLVNLRICLFIERER
jgi:hypothetical protein